MTVRPFSLNKQFKELLQHVEEASIKRTELIQLAVETTTLSKDQSSRFVDRNISKAKASGLITPSGKRNARIYHLSPDLISMLSDRPHGASSQISEEKQSLSVVHLFEEEKRAGAELKLVLGEIEAYKDYINKIPDKRSNIMELLDESKDKASVLYGRLNAIKKIIKFGYFDGEAEC